MLNSKLIIASLIVTTLSISGIASASSSNSGKEAYDDNNKGSSAPPVVGSDSIENNNKITSAIPEPEVHAMLLAGLMLLGVTRRRKRNIGIPSKFQV